uniref:Uncharacterized protein n=1 Tax=Rhizophora mucronata TaxID=61149 RepID=A0A2P2Q1Z1_RHIMU
MAENRDSKRLLAAHKPVIILQVSA